MTDSLGAVIALYKDTINHPDTPEEVKARFRKRLIYLEGLKKE